MTDSARAKAIQHYASERPDLARQLAFFEKLWEAQDEFVERAAAYEPAPEDEISRALMSHRTMFSLVTPEIPLEAFQEAVRAISDVMAEAGLPEAQTTALAEVDLGDAISADALADALAGFDVFVQAVTTAVADERLTETLVAFILSEAMTPFLRDPAKAAVKAAGKFDWLMWDSGLCPACGTPASSGVIRDEGELQGGRRWLECPLCRTRWEYARVRCARCGSRDQKQLEYLFDEQDPGHRVHTCQVCHGYTPVVVERELKFLAIPVVEEVMLVPLEAVAAERGFTPLGDKTNEKPN